MSQFKFRGLSGDWYLLKKPFDAAMCDYCLSMHADGMCHNPAHAEFSSLAKTALRASGGLTAATEQYLLDYYNKFCELRERFKQFYPDYVDLEKSGEVGRAGKEKDVSQNR